MTNNLSLYQIETELLDLMRYRESVAEDAELTPQDQKASLEAIDQQIAEYVMREIAKVDGIAAYLRECAARAVIIEEEADRLHKLAKAWFARHDRLEAITLRVMQQTGATLLEGRTSTFKVRKNPPSVEVAQPDLVPLDYRRITVTMTAGLWSRLISVLVSDRGAPVLADLLACQKTNGEPIKTEIGKELKQGVGVPGCRLVDDKVRLVVE
jgi:Siphovirus Gp157